ncbi:MAG TPA: serine protease [Solirubrobacterales bacterium]|jgi:secreted trypsin-like serine protease|nr:serine protease [Solirubrobacterales bacterium]
MGRRRCSRQRRSALAAILCEVLIAAFGSAAAQAETGAQTSIIGGQTASIAAFPSLAFIDARLNAKEGFSCTGTVLSPRVILTAAHCVEDLDAGGLTPPHDYAVVTGIANPHRAAATNIFRVANTYVFPEFDPGILHGDAGILVLKTPTTAPPIPLPTAADAALYEGGAPVLLAGWGLTDPHSSLPPHVLHSTSVVVQPPASCKRKTKAYFPFYSTASQMCTTNPPKYKTGGCFGDSGGPVIANHADGSVLEIGVVSTGGPSCSTKVPDIFTRTDRLAGWASDWIAATEAGGPSPLTDAPVELPSMSKEAAKGFVTGVLARDLGTRFLFAREIDGRCGHVEPASVKCTLDWTTGPNLYSATVTVFYVARRGAAVWDNHYRVRWVNLRCVGSDSKGKSCVVHTRHH